LSAQRGHSKPRVTPITKGELVAKLEQARIDFHDVRSALSDTDWRAPSKNPGWTNGEVMFHVTLGFIVVSRLTQMMCLWARLPAGFSLVFAAVLNLATPVFNLVNAAGARGGARIYSRKRIGRRFDSAHASLLAIVARVPDDEWSGGMYYPTRWDSLFRDYMTLAEVVAYPVKHFRFHTRQLSAHSVAAPLRMASPCQRHTKK
jgi:mycothiol maleylpyruvate isomerase-like protein